MLKRNPILLLTIGMASGTLLGYFLGQSRSAPQPEPSQPIAQTAEVKKVAVGLQKKEKPTGTGGASADPNHPGSKLDFQGADSWVKEQFLGWMETDGPAVKKWLDGLQNEAFREAMIPSYLEHIAEKDPALALRSMKSMPEDLQSQYATKLVQGLTKTHGGQVVSDMLANFTAAGEASQPWMKGACEQMMSFVVGTLEVGSEAAKIFETHLGQPCLKLDRGPQHARNFASAYAREGVTWAVEISARPEFKDNPSMLKAAAEGVVDYMLPEAVSVCNKLPASPQRNQIQELLNARLAQAKTQQPSK